MKICPDCGASNSDRAKFCGECGLALVELPHDSKKLESISPHPTIKFEEPPKKTTKALDLDKLTKSLTNHAETLQSKRCADIMFVVDCTGSMQGELDAIRDAIIGFAELIQSQGVRVRVGLVEFRDRRNYLVFP